MRERVTTGVEILGASLVTAGIGVLFGLGAALIVAGVACLLLGYLAA